jgi:D-glycero-D-manno-heptose 1,7-bisphosphate phosphatase
MQFEKGKAVFLDRDGVINKERGEYTWLLEDFKLNDGVIEALKIFRDKNYSLIIISNQSGIAKGVYRKEDTDYLHLHLQRVLNNHGVELSEIYYCPHHPEKGNCICRKPGSLLLEKAIARFNLDPAESYFIGDAERDIIAGENVGVNTIRIEPNSSLLNVIQLVD